MYIYIQENSGIWKNQGTFLRNLLLNSGLLQRHIDRWNVLSTWLDEGGRSERDKVDRSRSNTLSATRWWTASLSHWSSSSVYSMIPSRGPYARANRPSLVKQEAQLPQRDSASTLCLWKSCRLLLIATDTIFEEVCNRRMTFKAI